MGVGWATPEARAGGLVPLRQESEKASAEVTLEGEVFVQGRTFQA